MDTKKEAGRRIREAREKLKLIRKDVEKAIPEISETRLANWEYGINMIGVEEAKKLAPLLHTSAAYLLTIDDAILDERAQVIIKYWNALDERGRDTVLRVAEHESAYHAEHDADDCDSGDSGRKSA
jgi:transcriptional regulator with XRE-family HTH domain